jgi:hypothetical protein
MPYSRRGDKLHFTVQRQSFLHNHKSVKPHRLIALPFPIASGIPFTAPAQTNLADVRQSQL